ncbi:paraquat-inducible protein A [Gayadomonas joobiniege]|uniref:paraquat-inducible protein A n=1 Tax=Gayadomonas joobiniege TaxID=1234606 RepID=UPI00138AB804|nr:paraquat-inducible protein A [Gayadomonas joobiniege]
MDELIICSHCDLLLKRPALNHQEIARCPRCQSVLRDRPKSSLPYSLSFSVACLFLMACALYFPILAIEKAGTSHIMYLFQASWGFLEHGYPLLFTIVSSVLFVVPVLILLILIYLLFPMLILKRVWPASLLLSKVLFQLKAWSMIDVFLIATLASLTKLTSIANIEFGLGLWAYLLFAIFLAAALANLNSARFWDYLEKVQCHCKIKQQHHKV